LPVAAAAAAAAAALALLPSTEQVSPVVWQAQAASATSGGTKKNKTSKTSKGEVDLQVPARDPQLTAVIEHYGTRKAKMTRIPARPMSTRRQKLPRKKPTKKHHLQVIANAATAAGLSDYAAKLAFFNKHNPQAEAEAAGESTKMAYSTVTDLGPAIARPGLPAHTEAQAATVAPAQVR
jgi:hypothetical protein